MRPCRPRDGAAAGDVTDLNASLSSLSSLRTGGYGRRGPSQPEPPAPPAVEARAAHGDEAGGGDELSQFMRQSGWRRTRSGEFDLVGSAVPLESAAAGGADGADGAASAAFGRAVDVNDGLARDPLLTQCLQPVRMT